MNGYLRAMRQYAVFHGRAGRAEFWQFTAVTFGLVFIAMVADAIIADQRGLGSQKDPALVVTALAILVHLLPAFSVTVRRLHDADHSGWLVLLNYLPPLNLIIVVFACMRGTPGPNRYGPDPLMTGNAALGGLDPVLAPPLSTPVPTSTAPVRTDTIAELERLGRLRREGHLSEAEFEVMKAETLALARR